MKIIHVWRHTKVESCDTNNCYMKYYYHTMYITLFGFTWAALEWQHNIVAFHDDNEVIKQ